MSTTTLVYWVSSYWPCVAYATICYLYGGFQKLGVTPKWMVKIMENHIKMDDLEVPPFTETPIYPGSSMLDKKKPRPVSSRQGTVVFGLSRASICWINKKTPPSKKSPSLQKLTQHISKFRRSINHPTILSSAKNGEFSRRVNKSFTKKQKKLPTFLCFNCNFQGNLLETIKPSSFLQISLSAASKGRFFTFC